MSSRFKQTARQEERCRHDIELPPVSTGYGERLGYVRRFHEAVTKKDVHEGLADRRDVHTVFSWHSRRRRGFDREDHVLFVEHLVVLETVHERSRRAGWIAGEKYRRARNTLRRLFLQ